VREALAAQPGLAATLVEPAPDLVAAPLASPGLSDEHAAGLDLILEGFLLHHGTPRHLDLPDAGRRVLAGDYCYAHGLVWVAEAGDLRVIELLADLVAMSSALVATGDRDGLTPLWQATIAAIASRDPAFTARLDTAKDALRTRSDVSPLIDLAGELPPAPDLEAALVA
jgi:hypothetical protein